jgi:hypothetical protein
MVLDVLVVENLNSSGNGPTNGGDGGKGGDGGRGGDDATPGIACMIYTIIQVLALDQDNNGTVTPIAATGCNAKQQLWFS